MASSENITDVLFHDNYQYSKLVWNKCSDGQPKGIKERVNVLDKLYRSNVRLRHRNLNNFQIIRQSMNSKLQSTNHG